MQPRKIGISTLIALLATATTALTPNFYFSFWMPSAQAQTASNRKAEADRLLEQGNKQYKVSQFQAALQFFQQALIIYREIGDRNGVGSSLNNLGSVYDNLGQYQKAIEFYQQSLAILREIGDRNGVGSSLNNLGIAYLSLGQYQKAIEFYQQSLLIAQEIGDRSSEAYSLGNLGIAYRNLGQYQKAIEFYQQSLAITKEIGDRSGEGLTLSNIGVLLAKQNQPELAIIFYKQSVNVTEAIHQDIQGLPKEQQQSYTETIADNYRALADLLLKQDRVLEAQRVLDLLKVQELEDYLRNIRGSDNSAQGLAERSPELQIKKGYELILDKAIQLGKELSQLENIPPTKRSEVQRQRVIELRKNEQVITQQFQYFLKSPEVATLIAQLRQTTGGQNFDLENNATNIQDNLKKLQQNAVILYPFILDDRLELVLVTPYAPPIRRTVAVKREELNQAIVEFRTALKRPNTDADNSRSEAVQITD